MAAPKISSLFAIGIDILNTILEETTGTILVQTGSVTAETAESERSEWWQHVGLISRPPKPTAKQQACQAVAIRQGDRDICIASRDLRGQQLAGNLDDGDTAIYAAGPEGEGQPRVILKGNTGAVVIMTSDDNTQGGNTVYLKVAPDMLQFVAPWGKLTFDASGFRVTHGSGASINLGGISIAGFPVPGGSYATISAGICKLSGSCYIGQGPLYNPSTFVTYNPSLPPPTPAASPPTNQSNSVWIGI